MVIKVVCSVVVSVFVEAGWVLVSIMDIVVANVVTYVTVDAGCVVVTRIEE